MQRLIKLQSRMDKALKQATKETKGPNPRSISTINGKNPRLINASPMRTLGDSNGNYESRASIGNRYNNYNSYNRYSSIQSSSRKNLDRCDLDFGSKKEADDKVKYSKSPKMLGSMSTFGK